MTSIKWDSRPFIYSPPPIVYGSFHLRSGGELVDSLTNLFNEISDIIYQAYYIKSYLRILEKDYCISVKNYTETRDSKLEEDAADYKVRYHKSLGKIITKLRSNNKPQGLFIDKDKIHFAHLLNKDFNPELTKNLLLALSGLILQLSPEPSIGAEAIKRDDYLAINNKLLKPDYYV